jgi:CheY-like chemotaxis protein
MSVLIIEDDESVRTALAEVLTDEGYEVELACDGQEALHVLELGPLPSLILLDLSLPNMDGVEFRARQLGNPHWASIPVIIISAQPDVERRARQLGADDFLAKPMSYDALIHVVQNRSVTSVASGGPDERGLARTLQEAWELLRSRTP